MSSPESVLAPCQRVRSTLLLGSLRALRARGHGDAYAASVGQETLALLSSLGGPQWLPIRVAEEHYAACDKMKLTVEEMLHIGAAVAPTSASGVQTVLHAARTTGATPWTALQRAPTYWSRMYDGSVLSVRRDGPKDATITIRANALARYAYWRIGLRGIIGELARGLALAAYAKEIAQPDGPDSVRYSLSWV